MPKLSTGARALMFALSAAILAGLATTRLVIADENATSQKMLTPDKMLTLDKVDPNGLLLGITDEKLGPDEARLYVNAGKGVTVRAFNMTFMCSEGTCQFTVPANREIVLTATPDSKVSWIGCKPVEGGRRCSLQLARAPVHVNAYIRKE